MNNYKREYFNLYNEYGQRLFYKPEVLESISFELEDFLSGEKHLFTKIFAKEVMFSHEIKANNQIEGYQDDVELIESVIHKFDRIKDQEKRQRIINLYHGYHYILKTKVIDADSLKKLYSILSKDLLCESDAKRMGKYYRNDIGYILKSGRLDIYPYVTTPVDKIETLMNYYFEFLNNKLLNDTVTDKYIKSQILHFYLVLIHPYFDVNGRTSRTLAMWYLLLQDDNPYIIFNRGIGFKGREYDKEIINVRETNDLTYFLLYMLKTVQTELEKEIVMQIEASYSKDKFTSLDYQTLLYFLTMNGNKTIADFATIYNYYNDKKTVKEIYETMLVPLIDNNILSTTGETKKDIFGSQKNMVLKLNHTSFFENNPKIRNVKF